MNDSDYEISWSLSSWLLAVFVILPLWWFGSNLVIWVSWWLVFNVSYFLVIFLYAILGYPQ